MTNTLLQSVDFIRADGELISGLVSVKGSIAKKLTIDEQAVVVEAKTFKHFETKNDIPIIDYVFFRRFSNGRSSQVAAYVVDNSEDKLDKKTLSELHRQVWLQGTTPLLYIAGASQIDILACAREPDFWDKNKQKCKYNPAKTFKKDLLTTAGKISDEMKKFSALKLANGTFWDDPDNRKLANYDKAAHKSLIQAILEADKNIDGENNPILRRLLLLMILIKYLEDRNVFPYKGWFGKFHKGAKSFFEVLKSYEPKKVNRLQRFLADEKFNGDIFNINKISREGLTKESLKTFAELIEGKTLDKQRYLWEQFSFEHLPVEVISHIYQYFIKGGHGAVYTPPFLAALLLDYAMPYNKITGKERVLDFACGSGVFLVGAFKRLINVWRSKNNWKNPSVDKLKETLNNSIYGVDLDKNAIDLTAFSLSLAICDALRPNVIWNELQFDYLRDSNLFETDFFKLLLSSQNGTDNILTKKFDIVTGNPPFESELSDAARRVDKNAQRLTPNRGNCPDNQTAYLFLEQALSVLNSATGRVCLIQPAGILYNRNVNSFRTEFFRKCCVETIFDFASIRKLYEAADPKTVAVFAHNSSPALNHNINHWTFRRTVSVKEKICFELDHYDHHRITQKQAENNPYIWRADLLGGGRLVDISMRFQNLRTLSEYIVKQQGWVYGEGFIAGEKKKKNRKKETRKPAPFLTGKPFLPTKAFTDQGIDEDQIDIVTQRLFASPKRKEQFTSPLILIKELDSLPIAFWNEGFLSYRHEIIGIHAPKSESDTSKLCELYEYLQRHHHFLRFMVTLYGARAFIAKSTSILKQDVDVLPYPEDKKDLSLSFWEQTLCDEAINNMANYIRVGQNSDLLRKSADKKVLCQYSQMFIKMLGSIYDNLKASTPFFWNNLICQPFYFGDSPELTWLDSDAEANLEKLIYYEKHERLRTVRVFRFYDKNVLLIVKPDRLRYWIRSTAIRDADDTLTHLYHQGY